MISKIRVLNDHTINKIAAGEVIENPSSVVKELVENSIDAEANEIIVEIQGGGRNLIRITDDGCGMNADDALLCFERHATSKLKNEGDIHSLSTMGFRGEAIPSIASISKFTLMTSPSNDEGGTLVIFDGGKCLCCQETSTLKGTTIEIKSLFFNVPVRKKFLKSPTYDTHEILKTLSLIAMGNPYLSFKFISEGKSLLKTVTPPPSEKNKSFKEQLRSRIENILGEEFSKNTLYIYEKTEGITLEGFIGTPQSTRHNRTGQYLFINKRPVNSPSISFAVKEGFSTALDTGRFPVFVLHLSLAGDLVDVNVHPQKKEVRLRQESLIKDLIIKGIRKTLSYNPKSLEVEDSTDFFKPLPLTSPVFNAAFAKKSFNDIEDVTPWAFKKDQISWPIAREARKPLSIDPPRYATPLLPLNFNSSLNAKVIATIPRYLLIDGSDSSIFIENWKTQGNKNGLILVDQKNAHARIIFEKLSLYKSIPIAQQPLLIPHVLELSPHEALCLLPSISDLNTLGISIKEFGDNTFIIDAIPKLFGETHIKALIADILLFEMQKDKGHENTSVKIELLRKIAQAASRASISAKTSLSIIEGQSILNQLLTCQHPYVCPLGKQILVHITGDDLAKLFQK